MILPGPPSHLHTHLHAQFALKLMCSMYVLYIRMHMLPELLPGVPRTAHLHSSLTVGVSHLPLSTFYESTPSYFVGQFVSTLKKKSLFQCE